MRYGVKVLNYLKGYYGLAIFNTKEKAEKCHKILKILWDNDANMTEEEMEFFYSYAFKDILGYEDELSSKHVDKDIVEDFGYGVNNNGHCSIEISDIKIINKNYVEVPN